MANLDKLLKKIEKNSLDKDKQEKYDYTIGGETYEVLTMTRKQKADFIYKQKLGQDGLNVGDLVKSLLPTIYYCFQLKDLAIKAKDAGYINSYYEVVETLFEPDELIEIVSHLVEKNGLGASAKEEIDELKK